MHWIHACIININMIRMHCPNSNVFSVWQHVQILHFYVEMDLASTLGDYVMGLITASMEVMKRIVVDHSFINSAHYYFSAECVESLYYLLFISDLAVRLSNGSFGLLSPCLGHSLWRVFWTCWGKSCLRPAWFSVSGFYFMKFTHYILETKRIERFPLWDTCFNTWWTTAFQWDSWS